MQVSDSLRVSISNLYRVFDKYLSAIDVPNSKECPDYSLIIKQSEPLSGLSGSIIRDFLSAIHPNSIIPSAFKAILPRILELLANGEEGIPTVEWTLQKLSFASWKSWDPVEVQAIEWFFDEVISSILFEQLNRGEFDRWLCGIAITGRAIDGYLFLAKRIKPAWKSFLENNNSSITDGHLKNSFWSAIPDVEKHVVEFLLGNLDFECGQTITNCDLDSNEDSRQERFPTLDSSIKALKSYQPNRTYIQFSFPGILSIEEILKESRLSISQSDLRQISREQAFNILYFTFKNDCQSHETALSHHDPLLLIDDFLMVFRHDAQFYSNAILINSQVSRLASGVDSRFDSGLIVVSESLSCLFWVVEI